MKYNVVIEKGEESFGAWVPELPGCVAIGDSEAEALQLLAEALPDHIDLMKKHGEPIPAPVTKVAEIEIAARG